MTTFWNSQAETFYDDTPVLVEGGLYTQYERTSPRGYAEDPMAGITTVGQAYTDCWETTYGEYLAAKKNKLDNLVNDLQLGPQEFQSYITEAAENGDYGVLIDALDKMGNIFPANTPVQTLLGSIATYLSNESLNSLQAMIDQTFPNPVIRQPNSNGDLVPSCNDFLGACCCYLEQEIVEPETGSLVKELIFEKCIENVQKSVCESNKKGLKQISGDPSDPTISSEQTEGLYDNTWWVANPPEDLIYDTLAPCQVCKKQPVWFIYCEAPCNGDPPFVSSAGPYNRDDSPDREYFYTGTGPGGYADKIGVSIFNITEVYSIDEYMAVRDSYIKNGVCADSEPPVPCTTTTTTTTPTPPLMGGLSYYDVP